MLKVGLKLEPDPPLAEDGFTYLLLSKMGDILLSKTVICLFSKM
jgi:hypothetical protein